VSDLQRYEEELAKRLKGLPLPDKKLAWDKMEKLLDEGNDDGGILPPTTSPSPDNGNTPWGLLILGVVIFTAALWFTFHSSKKDQATVTTTSTINGTTTPGDTTNSTRDSDGQRISTSGTASTAAGYNPKTTPANSTADTANVPGTSSGNKAGTNNNKDQVDKPASDKISEALTIKNDSSFNATPHTDKTNKKITGSVNANSVNDVSTVTVKRTGSKRPLKQERIKKTVSVTATKGSNKNSAVQTAGQTIAGKRKLSLYQKGKMSAHLHRTGAIGDDTPADDHDTGKISTVAVVADSLAKKDTIATIAVVKKVKDSATIVKKTTPDNKKKKGYFAAGLGEQQSIPKTTTVSAADYIPSVYLRYYTPKKWFLQAEFKYAAPEPVNNFVYRSTQDTSQTQSIGDIDTSYKLKAVYYHRFSLSFNYFVSPAWSVGAGLAYNTYSAQTTQTNLNEFTGTTDSLISSITTKSKSDSGLIDLSNYMQLLIETQYQWKRFSFGANYSIALGSFAKYTNQFNGITTSKSTNLLTVFIRYDLWKTN